MNRLPFNAEVEPTLEPDDDGLDYEPAPVEQSLTAAYAILERLGHPLEPAEAIGETGECPDCEQTRTLFRYRGHAFCRRCVERRRNVAAQTVEAT